jgi:FlaA1/EpsC-like NDP-sugar epimerase
LRGSRINGIKVFDPAELPALIKELQIGRVLLAMPAASRQAPARDPGEARAAWRARAIPARSVGNHFG